MANFAELPLCHYDSKDLIRCLACARSKSSSALTRRWPQS